LQTRWNQWARSKKTSSFALLDPSKKKETRNWPTRRLRVFGTKRELTGPVFCQRTIATCCHQAWEDDVIAFSSLTVLVFFFFSLTFCLEKFHFTDDVHEHLDHFRVFVQTFFKKNGSLFFSLKFSRKLARSFSLKRWVSVGYFVKCVQLFLAWIWWRKKKKK
jgi:hypothetical protein